MVRILQGVSPSMCDHNFSYGRTWTATSPPPPGRGGRRSGRRCCRRSRRRSRTFLAGPLLPVALIPNPDAAKRVHVAVTSRAPVDVTDKLATVSARRHQRDTEHLFALRTSHTAEHRAQVVPWAQYSMSLWALSLWAYDQPAKWATKNDSWNFHWNLIVFWNFIMKFHDIWVVVSLPSRRSDSIIIVEIDATSDWEGIVAPSQGQCIWDKSNERLNWGSLSFAVQRLIRYRLAFTSHRSNKFERDATGGWG